MARDTSGPKRIGLEMPKLVKRAIGNDPKRLKRALEILNRKKQLKFPGMKKGKSVTIKPVGMVFKVEKKLAAGLLKTGIKAAVQNIASSLNKPCGCQERQDYLNKKFPYKQ